VDKTEYLDRASEAFFNRVPAERVLQYREQLDTCRTVAGQMIKCASAGAFINEWLQMEPAFARLAFERACRNGETAPLAFGLVARYVLAREQAAKSRRAIYKCMGGESDRALNEACLIRLLGLPGKCANVGAFEKPAQATSSLSDATRSERGLMAAT